MSQPCIILSSNKASQLVKWPPAHFTRWVSDQNGPLPDIRNPFQPCPCAQMAAGLYIQTDHTVHMKSNDQMDVWSGEFTVFPRKEAEQQTAGVLQHMWGQWQRLEDALSQTCSSFWASDYWGDSTVYVCSVCLLVPSSLDIQPIHLFTWREGQHTGGPSQTHQPLQELLWAGFWLWWWSSAKANKHWPGWMGPLGGLTDSVSG